MLDRAIQVQLLWPDRRTCVRACQSTEGQHSYKLALGPWTLRLSRDILSNPLQPSSACLRQALPIVAGQQPDTHLFKLQKYRVQDTKAEGHRGASCPCPMLTPVPAPWPPAAGTSQLLACLPRQRGHVRTRYHTLGQPLHPCMLVVYACAYELCKRQVL